jgi:hypothetical protein
MRDNDEDNLKINSYNLQTQNERDLFEELTDDEKHFFPVIDFIYSKKEDCYITLMKKVDFTLWDMDYDCYMLDEVDHDGKIEVVQDIKEFFKLNFNVEFFVSIVEKYNIIDLHTMNLGVYNNHLVIIDFGWE